MKFRIEGEDYDFDDSTLTVKEARVIKKHTGMGLRSFAEASKDGDPDAIVAIVYLSKRRANEAVRWEDLDNLDLAKMETIDETVKQDEPEDADVPDPIWPSGETQSVESPST